jgi:formylglycine-generating enzyme required for sulfatase activity
MVLLYTFAQVRSRGSVVAAMLKYPLEYSAARRQIAEYAGHHDLCVSDMPLAIRAMAIDPAVRSLARASYLDVITAEYHGLRNGEHSYEAWHSVGTLASVGGLVGPFTRRDGSGFSEVDEIEWTSIGRGEFEGREVPRCESLVELRHGGATPQPGTPYTCALKLPADFQLIPLDADAETVLAHHRKGRFTIFRAGQLSSWQFMLDDRVLCVCGSAESREALADLAFGPPENGGEGWSRFGSHHDMIDRGFPPVAVGRPVFLYNGETGICGRIYGYGSFLAVSRTAMATARLEHSDPHGGCGPHCGMARIAAGSFSMGSPDDEIYHGDRQPAEHPRHVVRVDDFHVDAMPVTQRAYAELMGVNPSSWKGDDVPVVDVSWYDAILYCNARSRREGLDPVYRFDGIEGPAGEGCRGLTGLFVDFGKNGYRLPTEAEWEYACRAGTDTRFFWGDDMDGSFAWSEINTEPRPRPVGLKRPNAWGLYDMAGNVQEWCHDWYAADYYASSPVENPRGPESGALRVLRGGSNYRYKDRDRLRSANRSCSPPGHRSVFCGFRTVARA